MSCNNAPVLSSSSEGSNRSSISGAGEGAQAGPVVPSRPVRRNGFTERLSKFEKGGVSTNKNSQASRSSVRKAPEPRKPIPSARARQQKGPNSDANEGSETQVQEQERKVAKLKARTERAAVAEAEIRKLKTEREKLQADLAAKTQKAAGLETRVNGMASRLIQADKRLKNLESKAALADELETKLNRANQRIDELSDFELVKVPALEQRNRDLTAALQAASESTSSAPVTSDLSKENKSLRERLEIADAELKAANRNIDYELELEKVNCSINTEYAAVVSEFAAKDSQIAELRAQLIDLQQRYDNLVDEEDYQTLELRTAYLQEECRKLQEERDRIEYNALNGIGKFAHLKQKPAQELDLVVFSGIETAPVTASEPRLTFCAYDGVFTEPATLSSAKLAVPDLPVLARPPYIPPPTPIESAAPVKPIMANSSAQTSPLNDVRVTININADDKKNMGLLKRMQSVIQWKSSIDIHGPPKLVMEMWKAMEELEQDHAKERARVIELRAYLHSQALEIERIQDQNFRDIQQLKGRHCLIAKHRYLADHIIATENRLDMQAMLLAYGQEERSAQGPRPVKMVLDNLSVPVDDNLGA